MSGFMDKEFLLYSEKARALYHGHSSRMPIIDYHCHINAQEIYENRRYKNLADVWLSGDHYKWRLMRAGGIPEELITGNATGREKFMAFVSVLPQAIANPVYHWAHMELRKFFEIYVPIFRDTADQIWEEACDKLSYDANLRTRGIIKRMNVEVIITTDDPADSLEYHKLLAEDNEFTASVLPGFRPDAALNIELTGFAEYITKLGEAAGVSITSFDDLKAALLSRIEFFNSLGCRAADHGILNLAYAPCPDSDVSDIFKRGLSGETVSDDDAYKFRYALLTYLAGEYARLGWVMELHLGVLRDVNTSAFEKLGANTGFDCIGCSVDIPNLGKFLNALDSTQSLPKTLIFSINPSDNAAINVLAACFYEEGIKSKVQQGAAWWFNDSLGGISQQLNSFAEHGVLGNFLGMLTDSRSMLSYTRHEYFRRILCDYIGEKVDLGMYPNDIRYAGRIVQDISYKNARDFFGVSKKSIPAPDDETVNPGRHINNSANVNKLWADRDET